MVYEISIWDLMKGTAFHWLHTWLENHLPRWILDRRITWSWPGTITEVRDREGNPVAVKKGALAAPLYAQFDIWCHDCNHAKFKFLWRQEGLSEEDWDKLKGWKEGS